MKKTPIILVSIIIVGALLSIGFYWFSLHFINNNSGEQIKREVEYYRILHSKNISPNGIMVATSSPKLPAPSALLIYKKGVHLGLIYVECGKTYVIQRSYDSKIWTTIATHTFDSNNNGDQERPACERDFIDSNIIPKGKNVLFYRYRLVEKNNNIENWSDVGKVYFAIE